MTVSRRKKVLMIVIVIIVLLAALIGGAVIVANKNLQKLSDIQIEAINLETIPNGTYSGQYKAFPIAVEVAVTVTDHRIVSIDLLRHNNGQGGDAEGILQMVVDAQSTQVDIIAGATYSSKVILLAIQNALQNAVKE